MRGTWIQDYCKRGEIKIGKVDTDENVADLGIKHLPRGKLDYLVAKLPYGEKIGK